MILTIIKTITNDWNTKIKPVLTMLIIISFSIALGFILGIIKNKGDYDKAALASGHAQYNKFSGKIEWNNDFRSPGS